MSVRVRVESWEYVFCLCFDLFLNICKLRRLMQYSSHKSPSPRPFLAIDFQNYCLTHTTEMYLTHLKYIHTQRYTQWLNSLAVLVNIQLENSSHTHTLFLCLSEAKWSPSHIKQLSFISKSIFREIVISVSIHTDTHTSMQLLGKHCSHNLALSCPFHTR